MGARLARYTKNNTYMDWSIRTWDWLIDVKYIDKEWNVYDGADISNNCTKIVKQQFSYNAGVLLQGAAYLYNYVSLTVIHDPPLIPITYPRTISINSPSIFPFFPPSELQNLMPYSKTSDKIWLDRINGLLDGIERVFFVEGVAYEPACEGGVCTADMLTYKGFLHRWMAYTAKLAPETAARIMPILRSSTKAAVAQCTGGANGRQCGFHWTSGKFDGQLGVGEQMNVLGALSSLLALDAPVAVTNDTGGTSKGDAEAGSNRPTYSELGPITTGDRAGAGIVTVVAVALASFSLWWMVK
ncbi:hypothetical protein NUW58_g10459 [Xylaria curta]|uniref:Uncharacterized protein n=1 Tax=Xylaria curta TaxID=42375 RepID=A0ACC1MK67_9PEZI|nr:hypothetical protein NUW58_g10459 [Xylaria curta]